MTGPIANPAAKVAAKMPIARERCRASSNSSLRTASPDGSRVAPPKPMRPREAMRSSGEGDSAALVEPRPNTAVPAMSNLSLPNRSPRFPKAMSREPTTKP